MESRLLCASPLSEGESQEKQLPNQFCLLIIRLAFKRKQLILLILLSSVQSVSIKITKKWIAIATQILYTINGSFYPFYSSFQCFIFFPINSFRFPSWTFQFIIMRSFLSFSNLNLTFHCTINFRSITKASNCKGIIRHQTRKIVLNVFNFIEKKRTFYLNKIIGTPYKEFVNVKIIQKVS